MPRCTAEKNTLSSCSNSMHAKSQKKSKVTNHLGLVLHYVFLLRHVYWCVAPVKLHCLSLGIWPMQS